MLDNDKQVLQTIKKALDDKFAQDIVIVDIANNTIIASYFVIATAKNRNAARAMLQEIQKKLFELNGMTEKAVEGQEQCEWLLIDFGDIIIHIFNEESREFYSLERIWKDSPILEI